MLYICGWEWTNNNLPIHLLIKPNTSMTTKTNLSFYQFIFIFVIITTSYKCINGDLPWSNGVIIMLLCNIALMMNAEYQRCADRSDKKDKVFNNETERCANQGNDAANK